MASKSRGGLSKREFAAKSGGAPVSNASSSKKTSSGSSKLKAAEKAYTKSLKPTKEEMAAEKTLNDYQIQADKDIQATQKQAIPEFFVQGQAKNIEEKAEKISVPLRLQVATLKARREASSNVASAKYKTAVDSYNKKSTGSSELEQVRLEKAKLDLDKAKSKGSGGGGSSASDWVKVTVEKGPTGRVRNIVERNKKTGATRRTPVN